jgi:hypothetical protein
MVARAKLPTGIVYIRVDSVDPEHRTYQGECIYSTCSLNKEGDYAKNWDANVFETDAEYWNGENDGL